MVDFKRSIFNLSIHARNAFVNPTSQMAFELTRSAKERSTQGFFNSRIACAEVALAAFSQLTNGVLDAARHMLDVPVNILRGQLEDAGRDIVTSLKGMGSTMAFVAASVVLVVAGLIFPARVFSVLNTQRAISADGTEAGFRAPRPPSPPRAASPEPVRFRAPRPPSPPRAATAEIL